MSEMRKRIAEAMKEAMRSKDAPRLSTLRLITAAIKDRDIARRSSAGDAAEQGATDLDVVEILGKMMRQRQESAHAYEEGGRLELAEKEREEIEVIRGFLPRPLSAVEIKAAIEEAIAETGAQSVRDMGRVMALLRTRHAGRADFGTVGAAVRHRLG